MRRSFFLLLSYLLLTQCSPPAERVGFSGIIPQPDAVSVASDYFRIGPELGIAQNDDFQVSGRFLTTFIKNAGLKVKNGNDIVFIRDNALDGDAYALEITKDQIEITASSDKGAFYAVQSLRQIFPVAFETKTNINKLYEIPCLKISDAPQFQYRGMHLDVGRHMYSVAFIKKYIDALALLKMNTFHWHLTEDQGWRIEIKQYPRLQEVAAYRNETLIGHYNEQPQRFDGQRYGGFYSQEEIRDIVAYAAERFVTIIPEIEMPGHSQAAIAAYPELGCTGEQVEVATKWGVFEHIYCPREATFTFLENVLDEVLELFPSKYIHIGGDEAPKTQWKACSYCQALIKREGLKDEHELQNYFITRIEKYLNSKGRQIIGWDEILEGGLAPNATVMSWRGTAGAIAAAKQQHQVVMTPTSHCYFDYYQSENDKEPLAIGGFLPLEKVYAFDPIPSELTEEEAQYVWGAQGNIWTEYMPSEQQVEYMAFPRILAVSEVVWTDPKQKDYGDFVARVERFHQRLDVMGINYANHLYQIKGQMLVESGKAFYELDTYSKGKVIRYTLDGSDPEATANIYKSAIPVNKDCTLKARVFEGDTSLGDVFEQKINFHKGIGAGISLNKEPHNAYQGSGAKGLINGISGSDQRFGDKEWLGFWGEDLEIEIDLMEVKEINTIATRFYNGTGQWIYSPKTVEISLGDDSKYQRFELNPEGNLVDFKVEFDSKETQKIRLRIPGYGFIPEGQQGAGHKAWTFIDEIIIN
jgi:hexosaminidase